MVDKNALKGTIFKSGHSIEDVVNLLGISRVTYNKKVNESRFTLGEVGKIKDLLKLKSEEVLEIFFADCVQHG